MWPDISNLNQQDGILSSFSVTFIGLFSELKPKNMSLNVEIISNSTYLVINM